MFKVSSRYLILILMLLVVGGGLLVYRSCYRRGGETPVSSVPPTESARREAILYFASRDGTGLVAEARALADGSDEQFAADAVTALAHGSRSDLIPVLPVGTRLLGYREQDGVATLDFSRDMVAAHPGGSMSELLTVYGVVDTLAVNLPHIRKVHFLVEGRPVQTLKGHIDLRQPLAADFRFARPSAADEAGKEQEN